jgi:dihydropteroate synthase
MEVLASTSWRIAGGRLSFPRPLAVGIVNVTDDSFYEGARSGTPERAVNDGIELAAAGFDLLDVGAVAARSGPPVPAAEEAARLVPAIEGLAGACDLPITADTFSPRVARLAIEAGAVAINDIGGGRDPELLELAADTGCGLVIMHIEGPPRVDRPPARDGDPVERVKRYLASRITEALDRGVDEEQIAVDPGLDFDLTVDDDLAILRRLGELRSLGRPLFCALSRKDFLGAVLAGSWERRLPPQRREWATAAAVALAVASGAEMLRLHDSSALDAMTVAHRIAGWPSADGSSR